MASRWATEENGFDPWLAAIRSRTEAHPPTDDARPPADDARRDIISALQRITFSRIVHGLGYSDENTFGRVGSSEAAPPTDFNGLGDAQREVEIQRAPPVRGLNAVHFNGAFFPVKADEELELFRDRSVGNDQVWLVTALVDAFDTTEESETLEEQGTTIRSSTHLSRNGLAITKVEDATIVD